MTLTPVRSNFMIELLVHHLHERPPHARALSNLRRVLIDRSSLHLDASRLDGPRLARDTERARRARTRICAVALPRTPTPTPTEPPIANASSRVALTDRASARASTHPERRARR